MSNARKRCPQCGEEYGTDVAYCPMDGSAVTGVCGSAADAPIGATLGEFRILEAIGRGAVGRVYRAFQTSLQRDVAIKILRKDAMAEDELLHRFQREQAVTSRLVHPNVPQLVTAGRLPAAISEAQEPYFVMEYLDGRTLRAELAAQGFLPQDRALHAILQVCDAVGEAHALGVVHRDIKPDNIMLVTRGTDSDYVKVLDFGAARTGSGTSSLATEAGAIFGTAPYVAPEAARGQRVGPPADVYAIGTTLYECLTGQTPFSGESGVAILMQHANRSPPPIQSREVGRQLPDALARVIDGSLVKDPHARVQNAREFGRLLRDAAGGAAARRT